MPPVAAAAACTFELLNRDKRSVTLDLRSPAAARRARRAVATADVARRELPAATARRLGVDGAALLARHPHLVTARSPASGRTARTPSARRTTSTTWRSRAFSRSTRRSRSGSTRQPRRSAAHVRRRHRRRRDQRDGRHPGGALRARANRRRHASLMSRCTRARWRGSLFQPRVRWSRAATSPPPSCRAISPATTSTKPRTAVARARRARAEVLEGVLRADRPGRTWCRCSTRRDGTSARAAPRDRATLFAHAARATSGSRRSRTPTCA